MNEKLLKMLAQVKDPAKIAKILYNAEKREKEKHAREVERTEETEERERKDRERKANRKQPSHQAQDQANSERAGTGKTGFKAQFIHIETYSDKPVGRAKRSDYSNLSDSEKKRALKDQRNARLRAQRAAKKPNAKQVWEQKVKSSARDVVAEIARELLNATHIEQDEKPDFLIGSEEDLKKLSEEIEQLALQKKPPRRCLTAGVISLPDLSDLIPSVVNGVKLTDEEKAKQKSHIYADYLKSSCEFLVKEYGENLRAVVLHTDEMYKSDFDGTIKARGPHIHFVVKGDGVEHCNKAIRAKERIIAKACEFLKVDNLAEVDEVKRKKINFEANKAYIKEMKRLQDDFFVDVSSHYGLTRLGPQRKRETNEEIKDKKLQAKTEESYRRSIRNLENKVKRTQKALKAKEIELQKQKDAFNASLFGKVVNAVADVVLDSVDDVEFVKMQELQQIVEEQQQLLIKSEESFKALKSEYDERAKMTLDNHKRQVEKKNEEIDYWRKEYVKAVKVLNDNGIVLKPTPKEEPKPEPVVLERVPGNSIVNAIKKKFKPN